MVEADGRLLVRDLACGRCVNCRAGAPLWCSDPADEGPVLLDLSTYDADALALLRALTAATALAESGVSTDSVVLVLDEHPGPLHALCRLAYVGDILCAGDAADADLRRRLAEVSPYARADVVVTTRAARAAVKAVVRGGLVCLPSSEVEAPSVTELVQREVRLVGAMDLAGYIRTVGAPVVEGAVRA